MLDQVKALYHRCRFRDAIALCDELLRDANEKQTIRLLSYQLQALFEIHDLESIKQVEKKVAALRLEDPAESLFFLGRVAYHDERHEEALTLWTQASEQTKEIYLARKSKIGIAACLLSLTRLGEAEQILVPLLKETLDVDEKISVLHGLGLCRLASNSKSSKELFLESLGLSQKQEWKYWELRSLLNLGIYYHTHEQFESLRPIQEILRCALEGSECHYLNYLVNSSFTNCPPTLSRTIKFDDSKGFIKLGSVELDLTNQPLVFKFLKYLSQNDGFVGKPQISDHLWKGETYNESVHDNRIFNIVSRLRKQIEVYPEQSVCLQGSRYGYRLAVNSRRKDEV